MKRKIFVVLLASLVLLLTGCAKIEQGIVLNADGSGYTYIRSLTIDEEDANVNNEFHEEPGVSVIEQPLEETIDGLVYKGTVTVLEFNTIDEVKPLKYVEVIEEDDITTVTLKPEQSNEEMEGIEELDEFAKAIIASNFDIKLKLFVDGQIIETTGMVNEEENSVTWDLVEYLDAENPLYVVKYRKAYEPTKRDPITDGIIKPGPDVVSVVINNKRVVFYDQRPVIKEGRTLVPVRVISENLDTQVEWIPDKTVKLTKENKIVTLVIGEKEVLVEEGDKINKILLDVPAEIINGRTMIPLRAVAEIFDKDVTWEAETFTAVIEDKNTSF